MASGLVVLFEAVRNEADCDTEFKPILRFSHSEYLVQRGKIGSLSLYTSTRYTETTIVAIENI